MLQAANEELAKVSDFLGISGPQETASREYVSISSFQNDAAQVQIRPSNSEA